MDFWKKVLLKNLNKKIYPRKKLAFNDLWKIEKNKRKNIW